MAKRNLSLKLLIDTKANKVLFAEAGKDFVDFLLGLLSLPMGAIITHLKGRSTVGCLGNLYRSFGDLNESYMQPYLQKEFLLDPKVVTNVPLLLISSDSTPKKFYRCGNNHYYITNEKGRACPSCGGSYGSVGLMNQELTYVQGNNADNVIANTAVNGYVKGPVTYMVTDDLLIAPLSVVSGITMMNNCNVTKLDVLKERVVEVGFDEASLESEAVLTAVFIQRSTATTSGASPAAS